MISGLAAGVIGSSVTIVVLRCRIVDGPGSPGASWSPASAACRAYTRALVDGAVCSVTRFFPVVVPAEAEADGCRRCAEVDIRGSSYDSFWGVDMAVSDEDGIRDD